MIEILISTEDFLLFEITKNFFQELMSYKILEIPSESLPESMTETKIK